MIQKLRPIQVIIATVVSAMIREGFDLIEIENGVFVLIKNGVKININLDDDAVVVCMHDLGD